MGWVIKKLIDLEEFCDPFQADTDKECCLYTTVLLKNPETGELKEHEIEVQCGSSQVFDRLIDLDEKYNLKELTENALLLEELNWERRFPDDKGLPYNPYFIRNAVAKAIETAMAVDNGDFISGLNE